MTRITTNKFVLFTLLLAITFTLSFCTSTKKTTKKAELVSYENDLQPIMLRSCTPCHFPEKGRLEMLNTYETTKAHIDEILVRVQLPTDDKLFMPFKEKKQPLSQDEINLFKEWLKQDMPK